MNFFLSKQSAIHRIAVVVACSVLWLGRGTDAFVEAPHLVNNLRWQHRSWVDGSGPSFGRGSGISKRNSSSSSSGENDSAGTDGNGNIDKGFNLLEVASKVVPQGNIVKVAKFGWKFVWLRFMTELAPRDKTTGDYKRPTYGFDNAISSETDAEFPVAAGRYHVYVGNPCPWCHRVRLVVNLLDLAPVLDGTTILIDNPEKASRGGWIFDDDEENGPRSTTTTTRQPQTFRDLRELYDFLSPGYTGRCTAPLLVDWETRRIVSNESKDIVRMLPLLLRAKEEQQRDETTTTTKTEADPVGPPIALDPAVVPSDLQATVDATNDWIYELVNNGVYRCGFATTQGAYEAASKDVREGLARLEAILSEQDFVADPHRFTESDLMLLPTMLRFDGVYAPLFRAAGTQARLQCDYPSVFRWMKRCWREVPGVRDSIDLTDACESYYRQLFPLNPGGVVPSPPITARSLNLDD